MSSYIRHMLEMSRSELLNRSSTSEGLLFLGNPQLVFPRMLYDDPVLEPVDRNIWAVIKMSATEGTVTAFPSYSDLRLRCNIGSNATVSRSLSILRATRWLTLISGKVRDKRGRVRGNIYALHDEPLQVAETIALDEGYLQWLEGTALGVGNPHPRTIAIAEKLFKNINKKVSEGSDIATVLESPLERRMEAIQFLKNRSTNGNHATGSFFGLSSQDIQCINKGFSADAIRKIRLQTQSTETVISEEATPSTETVITPSTETVITPSTETVITPVLGSSSSIINNKYINTTTTEISTVLKERRDRSTETVITPSAVSVLRYPAGLDQASQELIQSELAVIPDKHHQLVLDALNAKLTGIAAGRSSQLAFGLKPYVKSLCKLAINGQLNPIVPVSTAQKPEAANDDIRSLVVEISNINSEVAHLERLGLQTGLTEMKQRRAVLEQKVKQHSSRATSSTGE